MIATSHPEVEPSTPEQPKTAPSTQPCTIKVYMMELWSFIPYYVGRLCGALRDESVEATLGSVRYHLDREYYQKVGLIPDHFLLDSGGGIRGSFLRRVVKSLEYVTNLFVLALRLSKRRIDVLHVQYLPLLEHGLGLEIWFLKWIRRRGIRIVYTVHNVTHPDAPRKGIERFRRAYSTADALICHGEEARTELIRDLRIPADKVWVIPHGPLFETQKQVSPDEARLQLGLDQEEPLVTCLGVISPYKGIPFLLDSWKRLKQAGTKGRLLIAGTGDPSLLSQIEAKVKTDGLEDSVDLRLQFIPVEQLPLLHQAADVLVYPYSAGTTSGALLTGLNYGKAIVATRLPFFQEYLDHDKTARIVDYGDVGALASSLQILIEHPEERSRIANALARQSSQGTEWHEIARKTRACYEAVAVKKHGH